VEVNVVFDCLFPAKKRKSWYAAAHSARGYQIIVKIAAYVSSSKSLVKAKCAMVVINSNYQKKFNVQLERGKGEKKEAASWKTGETVLRTRCWSGL
jgi:hypothetical protein